MSVPASYHLIFTPRIGAYWAVLAYRHIRTVRTRLYALLRASTRGKNQVGPRGVCTDHLYILFLVVFCFATFFLVTKREA